MDRIKLTKEKIKEIYLYSTNVENLYINEFLPEAPGNYVKIYLFGLMYAGVGQDISREKTATEMRLSLKEVDEAWKYWESKNIVRLERHGLGKNEEYRIVFLSLIHSYYGLKSEIEEAIEDVERPKNQEATARIFSAYENAVGRTISSKELDILIELLERQDISEELFIYAIEYSCEKLKGSSSDNRINYIKKVVTEWKEKGADTKADAVKLSEKHTKRFYDYNQIFHALGFKREVIAGDRKIMDFWFDEMGCSIEEILDACDSAAGKRDPSLKYVDAVLKNKKREDGGIDIDTVPKKEKSRASENGGLGVSKAVLTAYYGYIREKAKLSLERRKRKAFKEFPELESLEEAREELEGKLIKLTISRDSKSKNELEKSKKKLGEVKEKEMVILTEAGYDKNYLEKQYKCEICKDTGREKSGATCQCVKIRAKEAIEWNKKRKAKA